MLATEQRAIAELAFELGAWYADTRFDDHDASLGQRDALAVYLRLLRTVPVACELALNYIATSGLGLPRSY